MANIAAETEAYQALLEQLRAVNGRLDEEPWDSDLSALADDLDQQVETAKGAMFAAWMEARGVDGG